MTPEPELGHRLALPRHVVHTSHDLVDVLHAIVDMVEAQLAVAAQRLVERVQKEDSSVAAPCSACCCATRRH
jgi:hypothetical protein